MGTPGFAVASLSKLLEEGFHVAAVVTAPDKPAGRGRKVKYSPVKEFMLAGGHSTGEKPAIPILQPGNLKDPAFIEILGSLKPDLQVVVAFRMLPEAVWKIPTMGTFNLHASLLPQYRGAAPIHHVLMNGETETGVTTFMIDKQIDTGRILMQKSRAIGDQVTAGELHDLLMEDGAELVLETVEGLASGMLKPFPQSEILDPGVLLKPAPKIFREDCRISWQEPSIRIYNKIRGLSPAPAAFTTLVLPDGSRTQVKIFNACLSSGPMNAVPGELETDGKSYLKAASGDGYLEIQSIQLEGKRKMPIKEFLAGFSYASGQVRFS